jgi:uncharacterized protein involved in outer membrane biogenesis
VKLLMKLVMLVVVALVVLVFARNVVIKAAMVTGARVVAGMPLSIQKFDLDILNTSVDMEGLVIKNPSGFHDTILVDIPKILFAYARGSIFSGKIHVKKIEFDMKQFTVVKNEKGELNLDRLRALQGTQKPSTQTTKQEPKAPAKPIPVQIDTMRLKIGKVVYVDYSSGKPVTKEFRINLDQSYQNITDLYSVVRLIVLKAMMSSGISNLVNFDINGLQGSVTDTLSASTKMATEAAAKGLATLKTEAGNPSALAGQAGGVLKSASGTVENTAKEMAGGVKSVTSSLTNKLNPFKKSE